MTTPRVLRHLSRTCLLGALVLVGHAAWLPAKAALAQVLLERAWQHALDEGGRHPPWPWADVAPVARVEVPRLGVARIVLSGDSGRSLAFAPGWSESTVRPGDPGVSVVSAHRDTHFRFLRELVVGDALVVETPRGIRHYRVDALRVADSRHEAIVVDADADRLLLVTCYPFDALDARGPLRYVVETRPRDDVGSTQGFGSVSSPGAGASARGVWPPPSHARVGRGGRGALAFQAM
jgi:sortase A